jgi:diguanylate cyclase (GGDEF)-like protein
MEVASRDRPYLIVLAGSAMGTMHALESATTVIGRSDKADLRIIDDGISREHARVVRVGPAFYVEDLRSTNGTFCNGSRVEKQMLAEGDKILVGAQTVLKFTFHDRLDEAFQRQMTESALRDSLTKLYNKRFFMERIENEIGHVFRHNSSLALLFVDIDHFKQVNDSHGHLAGDHLLQELSQLMEQSLRVEDTLARYGGEEFAILTRGLSAEQAVAFAERLRTTVAQEPFVFEGKKIACTISVGVALLPHPQITTSAQLVAAADEAMYLAKRAGRNRVQMAGAAP